MSRGVLRSRRAFVASAAAGVGAAALGGPRALAAASVAQPSEAGDRAIFRFALRLETLQARFYEDALRRGRLHGELHEFAQVVADHERQHLAAVAKAAREPVPADRFEFGAATRSPNAFAHAARVLEDLGVAAYNEQVANLTYPGISFAARIVSVEGRHASWIRDLIGLPPAPRPADPGQAASTVAAELAALRFRRVR